MRIIPNGSIQGSTIQCINQRKRTKVGKKSEVDKAEEDMTEKDIASHQLVHCPISWINVHLMHFSIDMSTISTHCLHLAAVRKSKHFHHGCTNCMLHWKG